MLIVALINCPECGKEISDKAFACPNCGFPINTISNEKDVKQDLFDVKFSGFYSHRLYSNNRFKAFGYIERILGRYEPEAEHINRDKEHILFEGVSIDAANIVSRYLDSLGCRVDVYPSKKTELCEYEKTILDSTILRCPRCKSTNITTGTKGYGLVRGFLGSNKTVNRCGKCGYSWEP